MMINLLKLCSASVQCKNTQEGTLYCLHALASVRSILNNTGAVHSGGHKRAALIQLCICIWTLERLDYCWGKFKTVFTPTTIVFILCGLWIQMCTCVVFYLQKCIHLTATFNVVECWKIFYRNYVILKYFYKHMQLTVIAYKQDL